MSYMGYVLAAYATFALVLAWDWLSPRLQVRAALASVRRRAARSTTAAATPPTLTELER